MKKHTQILLNIGIIGLLSTITSHANSSALLVDVVEYHHELPNQVSERCLSEENCPEIDISYIVSNQEWVNKIINQSINESIAENVIYQPIKRINYELQVPKEIKIALDKFAIGQILDESSVAYLTSVTPVYLGHVGSLELFQTHSYDYWGGAHGMGYSIYHVLDGDEKKELLPKDIVIGGKEDEMSRLLEAEFDNWIVENEMDSNVSEYKNSWDFEMTENFTFSNQGLTFLYQPYQVAPYSAGMPALTIPYEKLKGIMKQKYLEISNQFE